MENMSEFENEKERERSMRTNNVERVRDQFLERNYVYVYLRERDRERMT